MSHTLRKVNLGNTALADIVIVNYAQGGESFTLAELGLTGSVTSIFLFQGIGVTQWTPVVSGGNVKLMDPSLSYEAPAQAGINFPVVAMVRGT